MVRGIGIDDDECMDSSKAQGRHILSKMVVMHCGLRSLVRSVKMVARGNKTGLGLQAILRYELRIYLNWVNSKSSKK